MKLYFYTAASALLALLPAMTMAAGEKFVPLVGIPYVDTTADNVNLGDYVNGLYWAAISIAAILAVVMIIYAGIEYTLADVVTTKAAAKKRIQGAIVGLIIVISAVLILNTINPTLTQFSLLNLQPIDIPISGSTVTTTQAIETLCVSGTNTNNCVVEDCGLSLDCEAWCDEKNGIVTNNPGSLNDMCFYVPDSNTNDDSLPRVNETLIGSVNCTDNGDGTFNCDRAIAECQGSNGTRWPETTDGRFINCYQSNDTQISDVYTEIQSVNITCTERTCTAEQQQCKDDGGRVMALRTEGWFDVSYYIVCEKPVQQN